MTCKTEGCERKPAARGVCRTCYDRLQKQVRRGTTSWGILVGEGKCKTARRSRGLTSAKRRSNAMEAVMWRHRAEELALRKNFQ